MSSSVKLVEITNELKGNFLAYAEHVIRERALPDVRDGLKPVHRRILWSMWQMGCRSNHPHKKSARIVGDVIGKYHPHGDTAAYDSMVRMAQPFAMTIPLVDGHGNFGSIDGLPPASARYCLPSGTPILLEDGTPRNIELLRVGDMVLTHRGVSRPVERVLPMEHKKLMRIELMTGFVIYCSPNHPLLVWRDNRWQWIRCEFITDSDCLAQLVNEGDGFTEADNIDPSPLTAEIDCCDALVENLSECISFRGRRLESYKKTMKLKPIPIKSVKTIVNPDNNSRTWDLQVNEDHTYLIGMSIDNHVVSHNTEARLSKFAEHVLFADVSDRVVPFVDNYTGEFTEPVVLPVRVPLALLTANSGIAVGMATNFLPFCLGEVCDSVGAFLDDPNCDLIETLPAPDFPMGGMVATGQGLDELYSGHGSIPYRATAVFESEKGHNAVIITSIPYGVNKAALIAEIGDLARDGKIDTITEVRDESSKGEIRICVELGKQGSHKSVLNSLYKMTRLGCIFNMNATVIVNRKPCVVGVREILRRFVDFRRDAVRRRTQAQLEDNKKKLEVVNAILVAISKMDTVVDIIKRSRNPVAALQKKTGLNERQSKYVFDMPLRKLSSEDARTSQDKQTELQWRIDDGESVLGTPERVDGIIRSETTEVKTLFSKPRRTIITMDFQEITPKELVKQQDVAVLFLSDQTVKITPLEAYRLVRRRNKGISGVSAPDGIFPEFMTSVNSHDTVLVITDKGRRYVLNAYDLPAQERGKKPQPIRTYIPNFEDDEQVVAVTKANLAPYECLVLVNENGLLKKQMCDTVLRSRSNDFYPTEKWGKVVSAIVTKTDSEVAIITAYGKINRFRLSGVRVTKGRTGKGLRAIRLKPGDKIISVSEAPADGHILTCTSKAIVKRTEMDQIPTRVSLGSQGLKCCSLHDGEELAFATVVPVLDEESNLLVVTNHNLILRFRLTDILVRNRVNIGVKSKKLEDTEYVEAVSVE